MGTLLIAVATPVLVVFTLAMIFIDVPLVTSNSIHPGVLIELSAVIAIVVAVIALRVDARGVPAVAPSAVDLSGARSA
ncbi:MAG: hypothetical protein IT380_30565 [Myxococcales bacterium]|nr:hypothetical protein [Myxococcales bacterium]